MPRPHFASASSTQPHLETATQEALDLLQSRLGGEGQGPPDLLVAFVAGSWLDESLDLPDLGRRLRERTGARTLLGCTAGAAIEGAEELEGRPSLVLFGARLPDTTLTPFRLAAHREYGGALAFEGLPQIADPAAAGLLLLGDPYSFPMPAFLQQVGEDLPGLTLSGAMASGGTGPGTHLLFQDDDSLPEGAVGLLIEGATELLSVVSQGCRPVGEPYVVTASEGHLVRKLRGQPAAKILLQTLEDLPEPDRDLFKRGAFMGLALDSTRSTFRASDLLARNVMGFHPQEQAIAVAAPEVRTGMTVQFMVRDSASASDELERILADGAGQWSDGNEPLGGLLFTCSGRGRNMFDEPDHDARAIQAELGPGLPLAGLFAGGEIGMAAGRPFLHGFTASLALLRQRRP